jgi:imidazolonepropionase-like amidohydrolase
VGYHTIKVLSGREPRSQADQASLDRWRAMMEDNLANFSALVQAGVQFVAGTDAGWGHTPYTAVVDEIALLQQGGLSAMEAIVAATGRAAAALDIQHEVGLVQEGYVANLLVVQGNPLENLRSLEKVVLVMKDGQVVVDRR